MKTRSGKLFILTLLVALACLVGTEPAFCEAPAASPSPVASPAADLPFVPVWVGKDVHLSDALRADMLAGVAKQEPDPQHIVLLIHGWMNNRESSTASFKPVAETLRKLFSERGQRVAVVGLQWDSYVGKAGTFVPQYALSMLGLARNPYFIKVKQARKTGRHAGREMVFALREKYPNARISILGHSMGCEITGHMVGTRLDSKDDNEEAYRPETPLSLHVVCLAGSDLDSGVFSAARTDGKASEVLPRLIWITVPKIYQGQQDNVLALHAIARGQQAMGNAGARMRVDQWDTLIGAMRLYYDNQDIPPQHDWLLYYTPQRLSRLVDAIFHVENPEKKCPELEALEAAKSIPDSVMALRKALDEPSLPVRMYVLYRLEKLMCGAATHLADGTISKLCSDIVSDPEAASYHTIDSPCKMVRQGFFPTPLLWDMARKVHQQQKDKKN